MEHIFHIIYGNLEYMYSVLILSKNESEKIYLYVEGFRVLSFCFILKWGGGWRRYVYTRYTGTSDFMMFRISFIWQLLVDYSASGVYMNMLFVVNSFTKLSTNAVDEFSCCILFYSILYEYFTFSVNVNVNMYHLSQNVTCIYMYLVYRYIILFQMLSVHVLVIK